MKTWTNKNPIVIPAGSLWRTAPPRETILRSGNGHIEHVFGLDDDSHGIAYYQADDDEHLRELGFEEEK